MDSSRLLKISYTEDTSNEEVLRRAGVERQLLDPKTVISGNHFKRITLRHPDADRAERDRGTKRTKQETTLMAPLHQSGVKDVTSLFCRAEDK